MHGHMNIKLDSTMFERCTKQEIGAVKQGMGEYKLAVLGVCEARWNGNGKTDY
jgi:hypothetical protein